MLVLVCVAGRTLATTARAAPRSSIPETAPGCDTAFLPIMWPARSAAVHTFASRHAGDPGTAPADTRVARAPAMNASPAPVASTQRARSAGSDTWPCSPVAVATPPPRVRSRAGVRRVLREPLHAPASAGDLAQVGLARLDDRRAARQRGDGLAHGRRVLPQVRAHVEVDQQVRPAARRDLEEPHRRRGEVGGHERAGAHEGPPRATHGRGDVRGADGEVGGGVPVEEELGLAARVAHDEGEPRALGQRADEARVDAVTLQVVEERVAEAVAPHAADDRRAGAQAREARGDVRRRAPELAAEGARDGLAARAADASNRSQRISPKQTTSSMA